MEKRIYLASPHMSGEEMKYINEAFETNWIAPLGKNVTQFEKEMCDYIGRPHAVALSSGTAAIHLGLNYLGVKTGDIVFCQSFTFSASCNPIVYLGATPVFIDSEPETWNMSPEALKKAYEKYPKPKAVVIVNLYGIPAKYDELLAITKAHSTPVLEDSAESLGSKYKGVQTGNFGDVSVLSFNGNKIITTSGGGMLLLNEESGEKKVKFWATQARDDAPYYLHSELGFNYRLSNICAGIGRGQLTVIDDRVKKKQAIYNAYKKAFSAVPEIEMMPIPKRTEPNCWLTSITLKKGCAVKPMDIIAKLAENNVEARPIWKPMHSQPFYKDCDFFTTEKGESVSEDIFNRGLCLPSDTKMTTKEQEYVIGLILELFNV